MRVLLDTNVVLDVLLRREPWARDSANIWQLVDDESIVAYVTATTITDIHYVATRLTDRSKAMEAVRLCLAAFRVATVDRACLERTIQLRDRDFEDDLQLACAESVNANAIRTRDQGGFPESKVLIWTPKECIGRVRSQPRIACFSNSSDLPSSVKPDRMDSSVSIAICDPAFLR